jgi:hypothetical protein
MLKTIIATSLAGLISFPGLVKAGTYGDDFGKCLVEKATKEDRSTLIKWMFFAMSLNPEISSFTTISDTDRDNANKTMADMVAKLIGVTCKSEAAKAIKYEGEASFGIAFGLFGQVAGRELFSSPEVVKAIEKYSESIDMEKLRKNLELNQD